MDIMVTGGLGFIGSNFINQRLQAGDTIHNVDIVTYAADMSNIVLPEHFNVYDGTPRTRYMHYHLDINDTDQLARVYQSRNVQAIVHFAAESHVDRSIKDSNAFIQTNINGTHSVLEMFASSCKRGHKMIHVSTDEVYGDLTEQEPAFTEDSIIQPNSPYAASKASSDLLCRSYHKTHDLPISITRCSNNYGPNQHTEKLIPLMITKALAGERLPVYGNGRNIRDWIHVSDHCRAISTILDNFIPGEVWNIGGEEEIRNIDIVEMILSELNLSYDLIKYVDDRKGHDWRYAMDITKISKRLGWNPSIRFSDGIRMLIDSYK